MTKRKIAILTIAIVAFALILLALTNQNTNDPQPHKTTKSTHVSCSNGSAPCIALIANDGSTVAKFNDFRFCGQGCINYLSIQTGKWVQYTGGYTLKWIGPANPPGREGTI